MLWDRFDIILVMNKQEVFSSLGSLAQAFSLNIERPSEDKVGISDRHASLFLLRGLYRLSDPLALREFECESIDVLRRALVDNRIPFSEGIKGDGAFYTFIVGATVKRGEGFEFEVVEGVANPLEMIFHNEGGPLTWRLGELREDPYIFEGKFYSYDGESVEEFFIEQDLFTKGE